MKAALVALLLILAVVATSARPLDFLLRLHGNSKANKNGFFTLRGPSQSFTTTISAKGIKKYLSLQQRFNFFVWQMLFALKFENSLAPSLYSTATSLLSRMAPSLPQVGCEWWFVIIKNDSSCISTGNITFGTHQFQDNHALYYRTLGLGHEAHPPRSKEVAVSTIWEVFSGKGVFSGAFGTVAVSCRFEPVNDADIVCFAIGKVFVPN